MRILMNVEFPNEPFNTYVREGTVGKKIGRIVEETKPESIYFTEQNGHRGAVIIYQLERDAQVPALAEPWYLSLQARCRFSIAMTPDDLGKSGIDGMGKRWT